MPGWPTATALFLIGKLPMLVLLFRPQGILGRKAA
jgi:ABC-type branched-subunit amino acid transport system permease subunit